MLRLKESWEKIQNEIFINVKYKVSLVLAIVITYLPMMGNTTLGPDSISTNEFYSGFVKIQGHRWGMHLIYKLLHLNDHIYTPLLERGIATIFMVIGALLLCGLFHEVLSAQRPSIWFYIILATGFLTYPLIGEIYQYSDTMLAIGIDLCIVVFVVWMMELSIRSIKAYVLYALLMAIVASSFESCLIAYITLVMLVLFVKHVIVTEQPTWQWVRKGIPYAVVCVAGAVLRVGIGSLVNCCLGLQYSPAGLTAGAWSTIGNFIYQAEVLFLNYGLRALIYYPITVLVVAELVFVCICVGNAIHKKSIVPVILGFFTLLSLYLLFCVQGSTIEYRATQPMWLFCAIVLSLVSLIPRKQWTKIVVHCAILGIVFYQAVFLHKVFSLDVLRWENEKQVISTIGADIVSYPEDKPVLFVGEYQLGSYIESSLTHDPESWNGTLYTEIFYALSHQEPNMRKYVETNVNSVLNWSKMAMGTQVMLQRLFAVNGFDIELYFVSEEEYEDYMAEETAADSLMPYQILEREDYLVVNLGN